MTQPDFLTATRTFYNAVAVDYAEHFRDALAAQPLERAILTGFAELVRAAAPGPVADLGCGPGDVTAFLHSLGLASFGIDLSAEMVALARRNHPTMRFDEGSMLALDHADGSLAGVVAWYSTVHTPQERLPELFAEFRRVLAPTGHLLVAFQVGVEPLPIIEPFGCPVSIDFLRRSPDVMVGLLRDAGFTEHARLVRGPEGQETAPQAFLLMRHRST